MFHSENERLKFNLTLWAPISQNGQTQSNNSFGKLPTNWLNMFDHFVGLALKSKFYLSFIENFFFVWSVELTTSFGKLPTNWLNMFDHFVGLALKSKFYLSFIENFFLYDQSNWQRHISKFTNLCPSCRDSNIN